MSLWQPQEDGGDPVMRDSFILVVPIALTFATVFLWFFWGKLVS